MIIDIDLKDSGTWPRQTNSIPGCAKRQDFDNLTCVRDLVTEYLYGAQSNVAGSMPIMDLELMYGPSRVQCFLCKAETEAGTSISHNCNKERVNGDHWRLEPQKRQGKKTKMSSRNHAYAFIRECYLKEKLKVGSTDAICRKNAADAATISLELLLKDCKINEGDERRRSKQSSTSPRMAWLLDHLKKKSPGYAKRKEVADTSRKSRLDNLKKRSIG